MKNKGFTLIEALVAVTIVTLATVGPLSSASSGLVAAQVSRDKLTASYLAQESVEFVRAIRDNAFLAAHQAGGASVSDDAWVNFLANTPSGIGICQGVLCSFDPTISMGSTPGPLQVCTGTGGTCSPMYLSENGIYTQDSTSGTKTIFTRSVQISAVGVLGIEEKVVSTVSWDFHGTVHSVAVTETLTPWQ